MNIKYLTGDATKPVGEEKKIIAHICNDVGAWGAGFVLAISRRWAAPRAEYIREKRLGNLKLGIVKLVNVESGIWVANMIAQHDIRSHKRVPPIRYGPLRKCLALVALHAKTLRASVHMPRIGCGLAGGTWDQVESIIIDELCAKGVAVFVYDLKR